ncbi:MAG TPA: hypothetical protein VIL85_11570 [Thermomicrobiales bacterium]|jgi:hypothetical protein
MADTDMTMQDVLRRLDAAERQLALRSTAIGGSPASRGRARGRGRLLAVVALALLVTLVPLSVFAAGPFTDLDPAQDGAAGHNPNIQAIADAGITTGCNPPTNNNYCPKDTVTREQMASFLARTAGLGANKPVARAARLAVNNPTAGSPSFAANELVYVAHDSHIGDQPVPATATLYGQAVTITAPAAGFVIVDAVAKFMYSAGTCDPCNVTAQVAHLPSGESSIASVVSIVGTTNYRVADPVNWVFPVQAGENTFEIRVRKASTAPGAGMVNTTSSTISAFYVPFGTVGASGTEQGDQP